MFYDTLERLKAFQDYKNKKFKKSKNCDFSKGVSPWFWTKIGNFSRFLFRSRLDYQPLFGKMSPHSSPRGTRAISFVGFSQSCYRLQIFVWQGLSHKLSDQNKVVKMADDVDKMNLAFERVLECFKLQNLKDSQREALQNLVKGQDVFVIQPTGSGKSLIFQSAPIVFDTVRPLTNAKSIALVISPLASLMLGSITSRCSGK